MIGLAGACGNIGNPARILGSIHTVHSVVGVDQFSYDLSYKDCAITVVTRKELAEDSEDIPVYETESYIVAIEGYICPKAGRQSGSPFNMAEYVLSGWLSQGDNFIKTLNGEYTVVIYHKNDKSLLIFNDRFASRPLYYMQTGGGFYFGSERKAIFAASGQKPELSFHGIIEFFALSHNIGKTTLYSDVYALEPASTLCYRDDRVQVSGYWKLVFCQEAGKRTDKQLITDSVGSLMEGAEQRYRGRSKLGLGLSGGLDSRIVAATIPRDIRPVFARTYGKRGSIEVTVASEIARRLGFDHLIHEPVDISFSDILYPAVWRTEGSVHFTGLKSIAEHKNLMGNTLYNLSGHFGDVLTGKQLRPFMFYPLSRGRFIDRVFNHYISYTYKDEQAFSSLFNKDYYREYFPEFRDRFRKSLASIDAGNNWDLYDVWDLTNRQPRFTFCSSAVDNYLFTKIVIFTDYKYVDLMLSVPGKSRFGQTLYKQMIASCFNELADIPNANTGKVIKRSQVGNISDLLFQYFKVRSDKRAQAVSGSRSKGDLIRADRVLVKSMEAFIESEEFPDAIFSATGWKMAIKQHISQQRDWSYELGVFATFMAVTRLFLGGNAGQPPAIAEPLVRKP